MSACLLRRLSDTIVRMYPLGPAGFLGAGEGTIAPVGERGLPQRVCTLVREGDSFRLRDVGADRRGTLVNHRYVKDAVLVSGDVIQIGEVVLMFHQRRSASREQPRHATGTDLDRATPERRP